MTRGGGLVSVLFPVGPGVPQAGEALRDLLQQDYHSFEVIAILNGVAAAARSEFLRERDERLTVIDLGEKADLLAALDVGVSASRGRWLARMDSDDRCCPTRLRQTMAPLLSGAAEVASCGIRLEGAQGRGMQRYVDWVNGLVTSEQVWRERFVESPVVQPTVILSREVLEEAGGYRRDDFAEDYSLWLRLCRMGARFAKVREELYFWRDREGRLTRSDPRFSQRRMLQLKAEALAELPQVRARGVAFGGAGPIARKISRALIQREVEVHGFFEVDRKKIGRECRGRPVVGMEKFGKQWREAVFLGAVGLPGVREDLRERAETVGFMEGDDFFCCC